MSIQDNNEDVRKKRREYNRRYIQKHRTEERICVVCKKQFKVIFSPKHLDGPNVKKTCSKECRKIHVTQITKDWVKANPQRAIDNKKQIQQNRKFSVMAIYSEGQPKCACCGEPIIEFLTIDHINNDGAKQRREIFGCRTRGGYSFYLWIIKNDFPEDLQVLCGSCQLGRKLNGGVCPHEFYHGQ